MMHRGVTTRSPRSPTPNCGGFKNSNSPTDRMHKPNSIAHNASAIQHDRLHRSIEIESIESWNMKQNLSQKASASPSLKHTQISKNLIQKNSDEVDKIVRLSSQTTNLLNISEGGDEKSLSVVGNKSEVLESTRNTTKNVAVRMRDLQNIHYDARQTDTSKDLRKTDQIAYKGNKDNATRKGRPKTATSTRMKQKRGKGAVLSHKRRQKSASYSTRNYRPSTKQITNPVLRQMVFSRYRHIVYSVPIKQNSTREVFRRIAEIEVKPDLTKNRETDLRVSELNPYKISKTF